MQTVTRARIDRLTGYGIQFYNNGRCKRRKSEVMCRKILTGFVAIVTFPFVARRLSARVQGILRNLRL